MPARVQRQMTNVVVDDLDAHKRFFTKLFAFNVDYDSEWFVHLISEGRDLELGLIRRGHDVVPADANTATGGVYLTFVVDDVDALFAEVSTGVDVIEGPHDTFYGQRRLLLRAPGGSVVDVSSPTAS